MSKQTKTQVQPLSENTKKAIIITAICVVAVIILAIALALILKPADVVTPTNDTTAKTPPTSSSTIKNGTFEYLSKDSYNNNPTIKEAQNWLGIKYVQPESGKTADDHGFAAIGQDENALLGIVNTNTSSWADVVSALKEKFGDSFVANVSNPSIHDTTLASDEAIDHNVYMIAVGNKEGATTTSAAIAYASNNSSESTYAPRNNVSSCTYFNVASSTSVKITVWLNTANVTSGKASVMLSKSGTSALELNRLAYDLEIEHNVVSENNGWEAHEFYVFNQSSSSKTIYLTIGLGNIFDGTAAQGVLFVDDVVCETISNNTYREYVADGTHTGHNEYAYDVGDNDEDTTYLALNSTHPTIDEIVLKDSEYLNQALAKVDDKSYSPFCQKNDEFRIYSVSNDGTELTEKLVMESAVTNVQSSLTKDDHLHISFWVRVARQNGDEATVANIKILAKADGESEFAEINNSNSKKTNIVTAQDIATDFNCGWTKYDFYIKPTEDGTITEVKVQVELGTKLSANKPEGTLYVTSVAYETVSQEKYTSGSNKISFAKTTATNTITNGSFSSTYGLTIQPESWTHVYAGDIALFRDGKADGIKVDTSAGAISGSGIDKTTTHATDDLENKGALKIVNATSTSHGYLSSSMSLSANSIYAISVLGKAETSAKPSVYVINSELEGRDKDVIAKIESVDSANVAVNEQFGKTSLDEGWTRYYFVIVTGSDAINVRLALFNGAIDADETTGCATDSVWFDNATLDKIGSYTLATSDDETATLKEVTTTATAGYSVISQKLELESESPKALENGLTFTESNVAVSQPSADDWKEIRALDEVVEEEPTDNDNPTTDTTKQKSEVNVVLLVSAMSSILLVAALLIVVVIKVFQKRK